MGGVGGGEMGGGGGGTDLACMNESRQLLL